MIKSSKKYRLKSGETLTVKILEPPLGYYSDKVTYWWGEIKDRLLKGKFSKWSLDRFFVGELNGEVVGSMSSTVPVDTRDVGVVGMVFTKETHRGKGIAMALMHTLIETFKKEGGLMLHLCTVNPHAFKMYEKAGFKCSVGDGMRYFSPGNEDFDHTYLAYAGKAVIREGHWGDLARLSVLYNYVLPDWLIKHYPQKIFRNVRFESQFLRMIRNAEEDKGCLLVLENPKKRVVGSSCFEEVNSFHEQHVRTMDFCVHPDYFNQSEDFLRAIIKKAEESKAEIIETYLAECDVEKINLLEQVGFKKEAGLQGRFKLKKNRVNLLIFTLNIEKKSRFFKDEGFYYGGRPKYLSSSRDAKETKNSYS